MKPRIYLDLDGVMADFDKFFLQEFGVESHKVEDDHMWRMINGYGDFFGSLPLCEDALDFYEDIEGLDITVLTACPKTNYQMAARSKRQWVYKHISSDLPVIPMLGGKNKTLFMHKPGDILIDDFEKNCIPWKENGGIPILHKNFTDTRNQLRGILNDAKVKGWEHI